MVKRVLPGCTRYTLSRAGGGVGAGSETTTGLTRVAVRVSMGGGSETVVTGGGSTAGGAGVREAGSRGAGRTATAGTATGVGAAAGGEATGIGRTTTGIGVDSTPRLGGGSARLACRGASSCDGEAIAGVSSPTARASRVTGRDGSTKALKVPGSPTVRASIETAREGSVNSRSPKYCL